MTKLHFSKLFSEAWLKASNPSNIVSGFRKTGICPLNSAAIKVPELPHGTEPELLHETQPEDISESMIGGASDDDDILFTPPESSMPLTSSAVVDLVESGGENESTISIAGSGSLELFSSPAQSLSPTPRSVQVPSTPSRPTSTEVPCSPSLSLTETRKVISAVYQPNPPIGLDKLC